MSAPRDFGIVVDAFFDGERFHDGPTSLLVEKGSLRAIRSGDAGDELAGRGLALTRAPFLMPGMVDAHVHLFLDGAPTDLAVRAAHMKKSVPELIEAARGSARASVAHGVSMVRDAGDKHGVNTAIKRESADPANGFPQVRNGGSGLRRPKRYGAFMAEEVIDADAVTSATVRLARAFDEVKLILTGIIDFEAGAVTDEPQFDLDAVRLIVETARRHGRSVFAHCSGIKGLEIASRAGVGSIEHGFFMTRDVLARMRDADVAWCPTFSPVHAQWADPAPMKWSEQTVANLRRILDGHAEHLRLAHDMGVTLLLGTDAGSMGVPHGAAMLTELRCFLDAGLPLDGALRAATGAPRRRFGEAHARLAPGAPFDAFCYAGDPRENLAHLARPDAGWLAGQSVAA